MLKNAIYYIFLFFALKSFAADMNEKDHALKKALVLSRYDQARELIQQGADLEQANSLGQTLLHQNISNADKTKFLIENGANWSALDGFGHTIFERTADESIWRILVEAGVDPNIQNQEGKTRFFEALKYKNLAKIRLLHDLGGDLEKRDLEGQTPLFSVLIEYMPDLKVVSLLLELGAKCDDESLHNFAGRFALEEGYQKNKLQKSGILKLLDEQRRSLIFADLKKFDGEFFLQCVRNKDHACLEKLLKMDGANINYSDPKDGETALHIVAENGDIAIMNSLIQNGIELNPRAHNSMFFDLTPLHIASYFGSFDSLLTLINAGADLSAVGRMHEVNYPIQVWFFVGEPEKDKKVAFLQNLLIEGGHNFINPEVFENGGQELLRIAKEHPLDEMDELFAEAYILIKMADDENDPYWHWDSFLQVIKNDNPEIYQKVVHPEYLASIEKIYISQAQSSLIKIAQEIKAAAEQYFGDDMDAKEIILMPEIHTDHVKLLQKYAFIYQKLKTNDKKKKIEILLEGIDRGQLLRHEAMTDFALSIFEYREVESLENKFKTRLNGYDAAFYDFYGAMVMRLLPVSLINNENIGFACLEIDELGDYKFIGWDSGSTMLERNKSLELAIDDSDADVLIISAGARHLPPSAYEKALEEINKTAGPIPTIDEFFDNSKNFFEGGDYRAEWPTSASYGLYEYLKTVSRRVTIFAQ